MKSRLSVLSLICVLVVSGLTSAQNSRNSSQTAVLLKAGRLLDVRNGRYLLNQGLLVKNGRIVHVGEFSKIRERVQRKVTTMNLSQLTLVPGLIDSHSHLFSASDGRIDTTLQMSHVQRLSLAERNAREVLEVGITTVRNLGGSGVNGDVVLRDLINAGRATGPRIVAATRNSLHRPVREVLFPRR